MKTNHQKKVTPIASLLILLISILSKNGATAQDSLYAKKGTFKVALLRSSNNRMMSGYLSSFSDSSVYVSSNPVRFGYYANTNSGSINIAYNEINDIRVGRKGSALKGILIGALTGAAFGAAIGFASADDTQTPNQWFCFCLTAGEKAKALGVTGGVVGVIIGGLVGSLAHKTFTIKSKKEKFDEFKWAMLH